MASLLLPWGNSFIVARFVYSKNTLIVDKTAPVVIIFSPRYSWPLETVLMSKMLAFVYLRNLFVQQL